MSEEITVDCILDWASNDAGPICCDAEYARLENIMRAAPDLLDALENLVRINEQHNLSVQAVKGKPSGWKDDYLNQARAAISKAKGESHDQE